MPQPSGLLHPFLLPSSLPLPISSTYEFSFIRTKIRLLSKGQSDELKEKCTLLDLCPLGYKYSEQVLGEILCLHGQTPGSTFPPPSSSHPLCYSRTTEKSKHLPVTGSTICPQKAFALLPVSLGLPRDKQMLSKFNHQQG